MFVTKTQQGTSTSFTLDGRFDAFETEIFRQKIDDALDAGQTNLLVDLSQVTFIDSSGLAELVRGMKRSRQAGGDLQLLQPSNPVAVILELTGLDKAFVVAN